MADVTSGMSDASSTDPKREPLRSFTKSAQPPLEAAAGDTKCLRQADCQQAKSQQGASGGY
eukprot:4847106-Prymnesium_polylepis.1